MVLINESGQRLYTVEEESQVRVGEGVLSQSHAVLAPVLRVVPHQPHHLVYGLQLEYGLQLASNLYFL